MMGVVVYQQWTHKNILKVVKNEGYEIGADTPKASLVVSIGEWRNIWQGKSWR